MAKNKTNKKNGANILWFEDIGKEDVKLAGGKNASLGEMFSALSRKGIKIPNGFCLTSKSYRDFLKENKLDKKLEKIFSELNPKNLKSIQKTSKKAMSLIENSDFSEELKKEIKESYKKLSKQYGESKTDVAVRSSATAEDLPSASFAGQHETFLNVRGGEQLLRSAKKCIASMFGARAIAYREEKGFDHLEVALSVGVQKMVRSDKASSGVIFTIDTESGFENVVIINSIYGVGEMIVKGKITPDEFYVFKPSLKNQKESIIVKNLGRKTKKYIYGERGGVKEKKVKDSKQLAFSISDKEAEKLARWSVLIEKHYKAPQDIEWAKDGKTGELFIVQSRPETVHSAKKLTTIEEYEIKKGNKKPLLIGTAVGNKIGQGRAKVINSLSGIGNFKKGEVLVTKMTDPDWVPIMRMSSAIVTEEGGRTCHAAIVARELGIPCVVGAGKSVSKIKSGEEITVNCASGTTGEVFRGKIPYKLKKFSVEKSGKLPTKIMINIGTPDSAFKNSSLPVDGVGLAREEFIITEKIKIHPLFLYHFRKIKKEGIKFFEKRGIKTSKKKLDGLIKKTEKITIEHKNKRDYFTRELAEGIAQISAAFYPRMVIVRFSDFKTNEYRELLGGEFFEPTESNPMMGWRGASRYYDKNFKPAFEMECRALKRVRDDFGLKNTKAMIPFCRTAAEAKKTLKIMEDNELKRGRDKFQVFVMCEVPSNVILVDKFLDYFDGMSIGSNDLTQLTLGIDRDNSSISQVGDERNEAVKIMISKAIKECRKRKKYSGICGQGPSDFPEFAEFLKKEKIESISLNPDTVLKTIEQFSKKKKN